MVAREREDAPSGVFGHRTRTAGIPIRGKIGEKRIEISSREDIRLLETVVDQFASFLIAKEDGAIGEIWKEPVFRSRGRIGR